MDDINTKTCNCRYCGYKFNPQKAVLSETEFVAQCPNCELNTPIPFLLALEVGGKIPDGT